MLARPFFTSGARWRQRPTANACRASDDEMSKGRANRQKLVAEQVGSEAPGARRQPPKEAAAIDADRTGHETDECALETRRHPTALSLNVFT